MNSMYSGAISFGFMPISAIIIDSVTSSSNQIAPNLEMTYQVNYVTLGEPSCARIVYTSTGYQSIPFAIGTNASTCAQIYPGVAFNQTYNKTAGIWQFSSIMRKVGYIKITANVSNLYTSNVVSSFVTVSLSGCSQPVLSLENQATDFYSPLLQKRSQKLSVVASAIISCSLSVNNTKTWTLYSIDSSNGNVLSQVSLAKNKYAFNSELVISENTLDYGLYKFVYTMSMYSAKVDLSQFLAQIETYIQIVPTGLTVLGLYGGSNQVEIGLNQTFEINPMQYSFDNDNVANVRTLNFKFYCNVIDGGIPIGLPYLSKNVMADLYSLTQIQYSMSYNSTCFNDTSKKMHEKYVKMYSFVKFLFF
jgi:hypothetical protein